MRRNGSSVLTFGGNDASTEYYGTIADRYMWYAPGAYIGSVTKTGIGTFTLWGEEYLAGTTTVQRGTMLANGLVSSLKTVVDGTAGVAVLGGSGLVTTNGLAVTNAVELRNGGVLAPGYQGQGMLTINGNVAFDSASAYQVTLGGTNDGVNFGQASVAGTINPNGAALNVVLAYAPQAGQHFTIMNNPAGTTIGGQFAGGGLASATYGGRTYYFSVNYAGGDGNDIVLTALPAGALIGIH